MGLGYSSLKKTIKDGNTIYTIKRSNLNTLLPFLLTITSCYALYMMNVSFIEDKESAIFWKVIFNLIFGIGFLVMLTQTLYGFFSLEIITLTKDALHYQKKLFGRGRAYYFLFEDIERFSEIRPPKSYPRRNRNSPPLQSRYAIMIISDKLSLMTAHGLSNKETKKLINALNKYTGITTNLTE